jgi:FkbM family methyltransferase
MIIHKEDGNIEHQILKKTGYFLYSSYTILSRAFHLIFKPRPIKIKLHGKPIMIFGKIQYLLFWSNCYESNTYKIFEKFIDRNHSYIDMGAFIGSTTLFCAHLAKKVYAIEPDPIAFAELEKNVSLNSGLKEKIELHQKCINDKSGKVRFGSIAKGGDSTSSLQFADSETSWIVDGITFNEFIGKNKISDCNFIKMDIEGGEATVLPLMKDYLEKNKPVLYLSLHPLFFIKPVEYMKRIIEVLKIYNNVYTDNGNKIELQDLLSKNKLKGRYAIVATDKIF